MTLDLRELPVIDDHVHVWGEEATRRGFDPLETVSLGGSDPEFLEGDGHTVTDSERAALQRNLRETLGYQHAVSALAHFLGCSETAEEVLRLRDAECADFAAYRRRLYADINLQMALIDVGLGAADLDGFARLSGVPCRGVYRIEPMLAALWDEHDDLKSLDAAFVDGLRKEASSGRYVSLKSIIAYRTGLDVQPPDDAAAARSFDALKRSANASGLMRRIKPDRADEPHAKVLRDRWLWRALEESIELGLPFQIHTGMGDQDIDIGTARPGLLARVFRDARLRHARIVLLHGAYPFHEEAAYLVNVFPNVHLDLSEHNLFLGPQVAGVLRSVFALAPFSKLLFGTDAYRSPDLQWIAARATIDAMALVLDEFVRQASLTERAAMSAAAMVLAGNARELYRL
jgi:predicted TIM-barrel fold metal-dependent hydrolase